MPKIIFSMPHRLEPVGPGRPITRMWEAIHQKWGAEVFRIVPDDLPELADIGRLGDSIGPAFDDLATERILHVPNGDQTQVFVGGGACLNQLQCLDSLTASITTWFSSYAEHAQNVLSKEYVLRGIQRLPIHPYLVWRAKLEQQLSNVLIVPSEYCKSTYPKETQERIRVVGFGVDSDEFKPTPTPSVPDPLRIIMPASNPVRKGVAYALQAFERMDPSKIAPLLTGGNYGGERMRLKGGQLSVQTPGWIRDEDMKLAYAESHVLLLPSLEEGQALAGLEGMACGLPVILTPETGHPIEDGKQGFIVPSTNSDAIQKALQYFVDNPGEVQRMGREARTYAEAHPWSKFQDGIVSLIEGAVA